MSNRTERVAKNIKEELGWMIEKGEIKDPRIGFATITDVDVSRDLRQCKVYFSYLGPQKEQEKAAEGFNSVVRFVRGELGRRLRLKYAPEIQFIFDPTVEAGARISKLLHKIHEDEEEKEADSDDS